MSITYPLSMPAAPGIASSRFGLEVPVAVHESPLSGVEQVLERPGARWVGEITLPPMPRELAAAWTGFLVALRGSFGTFTLGDPDATAPRGSIAGSVTATGAAGARDITLSGATGTLLAGDYIQIGTGLSARLHMVVQDWDAAVGGTVAIEPPLRLAASAAPVIWQNPAGLFRLAGNEVSWSTDVLSLYGITLAVREALKP